MPEKSLLDRVELDRETGRYFDPEYTDRAEIAQQDYWTAYCGGCGEEIDVVASDQRAALSIVAAAIELDYEPMTIDHIERRHRGLIYF